MTRFSFVVPIGAATAQVARVRTLPTFENLTYGTRPKLCSKVLIHYNLDLSINSLQLGHAISCYMRYRATYDVVLRAISCCMQYCATRDIMLHAISCCMSYHAACDIYLHAILFHVFILNILLFYANVNFNIFVNSFLLTISR